MFVPRHCLATLALVPLLASCAARSPLQVDRDQEQAALIAALAHRPSAEVVAREAVDLLGLLDRLAEDRADLAIAVAAVRADAAAGLPVRGDHAEALLEAFAAVGHTAQDLAAVAARHDPWRKDEPPLASLPLAERCLGVATAAAAGLSLYDAFLADRAALQDPTVATILERGDPGRGIPTGQIRALTLNWLSLVRRHRLRDSLRFLEVHPVPAAEGSHLAVLREVIARSPSAEALPGLLRDPLDGLANLDDLVRTDLDRLGTAVVGKTSQGFGNAMGLVSFRRGRLYGDAAVVADLTRRLRPGDILLEKTPFRLTDRFIPGHWGHVALWVGSAAEVQALVGDPGPETGARLAAQAGVCEALRDGVQLNTLDRFLNIDDLCILRPRDPARIPGAVQRALRQIGKEYDFNFDVQTLDRIVCSELVYCTYVDESWPTDRALGRWTISPDQVAYRGLAGGSFEVVGLWHDGQEVTGDRTQALAGLVGR
jgi:uncharacterized protein YycO